MYVLTVSESQQSQSQDHSSSNEQMIPDAMNNLQKELECEIAHTQKIQKEFENKIETECNHSRSENEIISELKNEINRLQLKETQLKQGLMNQLQLYQNQNSENSMSEISLDQSIVIKQHLYDNNNP